MSEDKKQSEWPTVETWIGKDGQVKHKTIYLDGRETWTDPEDFPQFHAQDITITLT